MDAMNEGLLQSMLHPGTLKAMSLLEVINRCKQSLITWHMPPLLAFALNESDRHESLRKAEHIVQLFDSEWKPPKVNLGDLLPHLSLPGEPRFTHIEQMEL